METTDPLDQILTCRLDSRRKAVEPCTVIIFGASGDLTSRKLIPALYHLHIEGQLPRPVRVIGFARREKSDASFRDEMLTALRQFSRTKPVDEAKWAEFAAGLHYCQGEFTDPNAYKKLEGMLDSFGDERLRHNLLFYLSTSPTQFAEVASNLSAAKLLHREATGQGWERLVVEKPFGTDLPSAQALSAELTKYARERQLFRIDHYLGKETVQNILMFRFSNSIFETLWNRRSIDHVQITVSEKHAVGTRGGYYEDAGAIRDMVQNHLLQVLALIAMEPPVNLEAESIRDEKVKLLKSVRQYHSSQVAANAVRGQYAAGSIDGQARPAYRQEPKVKADSSVETFVALRLFIDNWRWAGVPFYLRTGKNLPVSASEVRVQFHQTPNVLFAAQCGTNLDSNSLTLRLQPNESIFMHINGKVPGTSMEIRPVRMHFDYDTEFGAYTPEAYERLLLEAIAGDATLFIRRDEVEAAWSLIDPIREAWTKEAMVEKEFYPAGSWGPSAADELLAKMNHRWRKPHPTN